MWAENLGGQQSISIAQVKSLLEARVLVVVDFSISETGSWQRPWNSHDDLHGQRGGFVCLMLDVLLSGCQGEVV